jgi:spore cortex formation protein SpoVR/YcgB (stage V sporulation)
MTEDAEENQEDGRRRQTHEKGEEHIVAVVETRAASIEAWQREANTAEEPC